jgi:hypothetical protein
MTHDSCTPNAELHWDLDSMSFTVRAIRDLQPDEQITISYCDIYMPREMRRRELQLKYKFLCTCPSCALPDAESARSDQRRHLLRMEVYKADSLRDDRPLREWASNPALPDNHIVKYGLKILGIMEEEGLYEEEIWSVHYAWLCKVSCALGDREAARGWAKKAAVMMTVYTASDGGWNKVVDDPEKTEWWGIRLD